MIWLAPTHSGSPGSLWLDDTGPQCVESSRSCRVAPIAAAAGRGADPGLSLAVILALGLC